jgi:hypothetical protein
MERKLPKITLGLLNRNPELRKAKAAVDRLWDKMLTREAAVYRQKLLLDKAEKQYEKSLNDPTLMEECRIYSDEMNRIWLEIESLSAPDDSWDESYLQAVADFVFNALKIEYPDYTQEQFESEFDDISLHLFFQDEYQKKKQGKQVVTISQAIIFEYHTKLEIARLGLISGQESSLFPSAETINDSTITELTESS